MASRRLAEEGGDGAAAIQCILCQREMAVGIACWRENYREAYYSICNLSSES